MARGLRIEILPGPDGHSHGATVECGGWCPAWKPTQHCAGGVDANGRKTECRQPVLHKGPHDPA